MRTAAGHSQTPKATHPCVIAVTLPKSRAANARQGDKTPRARVANKPVYDFVGIAG